VNGQGGGTGKGSSEKCMGQYLKESMQYEKKNGRGDVGGVNMGAQKPHTSAIKEHTQIMAITRVSGENKMDSYLPEKKKGKNTAVTWWHLRKPGTGQHRVRSKKTQETSQGQ